jgi:zinc/manganese transport system substrate-binding protein
VSVITDPNVDPHEYESNPQNAVAVANAQMIIENGVGYDNWMTRLIAASSYNPNQVVLNVGNLLGVSVDDPDYGVNASVKFSNEHFWYNPVFVNKTVNAMYKDLVGIDPSDTSYFRQNYRTLNASLYSYMKIEAEIKAKFAGSHVAATETIFLFMSNATGLDVVTPFTFMKAVAEGNDPSAQDVATFQNQLQTQGYVKELVYNNQTVSPLTNSMYVLAQQNHIPIARISETLSPVGLTFQQWMTNELNGILNGLKQSQ